MNTSEELSALVPDWAREVNCAITVVNTDCNIIYMNDKARATFASHGNLIGKNMLDCHSDRSKEIIRQLLATGGVNCYTIEKQGVRKMIYQTAWKRDGIVAGLVEISMVIPTDLPHYIRK